MGCNHIGEILLNIQIKSKESKNKTRQNIGYAIEGMIALFGFIILVYGVVLMYQGLAEMGLPYTTFGQVNAITGSLFIFFGVGALITALIITIYFSD